MLTQNPLRALLRVCFFSLFLLGSAVFAGGPRADAKKCTVYAQLASFTTQMLGTSPSKVTFEKIDNVSGIKIADSRKELTIHEAGVYFISVIGQIGIKGPGILGNATMWIKKNGKKVLSSVVSQSVNSANSAYNLMIQNALPLQEGDRISIEACATTSFVGLIATSTTAKQSAIPSIGFTIFKVE